MDWVTSNFIQLSQGAFAKSSRVSIALDANLYLDSDRYPPRELWVLSILPPAIDILTESNCENIDCYRQ